jgi:hypothetical protein
MAQEKRQTESRVLDVSEQVERQRLEIEQLMQTNNTIKEQSLAGNTKSAVEIQQLQLSL